MMGKWVGPFVGWLRLAYNSALVGAVQRSCSCTKHGWRKRPSVVIPVPSSGGHKNIQFIAYITTDFLQVQRYM